MYSFNLYLFISVAVFITCWCDTSSNDSQNHSDIILVGAYGDLAKKYLWKALFQLFLEFTKDDFWTFSFVGAGSKPFDVGESRLSNVLQSAIVCPSVLNSECDHKKKLFLEKVRYLQLKDAQDYAKLCSALHDSAMQNYCYKGQSCQYQRIFYLSVPPFAYQNISSYIASHCRPSNGTGSLKVVFEKPFGHSQSSAIHLADSIMQHLDEQEVYRVDHYLGKQSIQEILPFRDHNKQIEKMMSDLHVKQIEVVMQETLSVKGRTSFYDKYGVIADVMNNHLSEILYLLTMDLPADINNKTEIDLKKLKLLKEIQTVKQNDHVVGQYKGYQSEVNAENNFSSKSITPTFAGVKLRFDSLKWNNLSVIMVAGKKLKLRTGYARVLFKNNVYSVSTTECSQQEIIFHIGHGPLGKPAILVSKNLPLDKLYRPKHWSLMTDEPAIYYINQPLYCYHVYTPDETHDAYVFLVRQMFLGHQEHFLRLPSLLESWRVWGPVIENQKSNLKFYPGGNQTEGMLDFSYDLNGLCFVDGSPPCEQVSEQDFLGNRAVLGPLDDISLLLANEIIDEAWIAVKKGHDFHIALSGGSSPLPLLHRLSTIFKDDLVWRHIHVWQVDERCSLNSSLSNLYQLSASLFDNLPHLRFSNIHPMLVESDSDTLCSDKAAALYEKWIKRHLGEDVRFDYVILGMGADGHTASLFPSHSLLDENQRLVAIGDGVSQFVNVKKRMTMTFPLINRAKKVAVIVSGKQKCAKLHVMNETRCKNVVQLPVCGVSPHTLSWFIDSSCTKAFD